VGVSNLVGLGVQKIQDIEADAPAVLIAIADPGVDDAGGGRTECVVLREWTFPEIAPAEGAEGACLFADGDARGGYHCRGVRDVIARRIAELDLGKACERRIKRRLFAVEAD